MWIAIGLSSVLTATVMSLVFALVQKLRRRKNKNKEDSAFNGIVVGIGERLHAAHPSSKWRWVCRPADFATNGGIARIEVIDLSKNVRFMDVCLSIKGYMALHMSNVVELAAANTGEDTTSTCVELETPEDEVEVPVLPTSPKADTTPYDEETVTAWYNIVFIETLTALINDLNAKGEVCVYINRDGEAYIEDWDDGTIVCTFAGMPDVALWGHITDKLGESGLFAEVEEDNCIFISWA